MKKKPKKKTASQRAAYEFGKAAMPSKKRSSKSKASSVSNADLRKRAGASSVSDRDVAMARAKKKDPMKKKVVRKKAVRKK